MYFNTIKDYTLKGMYIYVLFIVLPKLILMLSFQTTFNTVLIREKLKKENIINELSDKLKLIKQQQERDKGKHAMYYIRVAYHSSCSVQY